MTDMWTDVLPDLLVRYVNQSLDYKLWQPGMTCSICGTPIEPWQHFNWDHDVPIAAGGRRGKVNKKYAHCLCNSVKGDRHPFSLRTDEDRNAVRAWVRPRTWERLQKVWAGENA